MFARLSKRFPSLPLQCCRARQRCGYSTAVPTSLDLAKQHVYRPRLEQHYYNTLLEDIMILSYDHDSPMLEDIASNPEFALHAQDWKNGMLGKVSEINSFTSVDSRDSVSDKLLEKILTCQSLDELPTSTDPSQPPTTSLLLQETIQANIRPTKIRSRNMIKNPIDYTTLPKKRTNEISPREPTPFAPIASHLPVLKHISLHLTTNAAIENKYVLLSALMALECMTGVTASPYFAPKGRADIRIRAGQPIGAQVKLEGAYMWNWVDMLVQIVMPRLREFEGVPDKGLNARFIGPKGDIRGCGVGSGVMTLSLPDQAMSLFPAVEPHYDMFPKFFDFNVSFHTTGHNDKEAILALSGLGLPFYEETWGEDIKDEDENDPWAKFKKERRKK